MMQRLPTWAIYNMAPGAQGGMVLGDGQDEMEMSEGNGDF